MEVEAKDINASIISTVSLSSRYHGKFSSDALLLPLRSRLYGVPVSPHVTASVTALLMYRQLARMSRTYGSPYTTTQAWGEHRIEIAVIDTESHIHFLPLLDVISLWRFKCLRSDMQIWF